MAIKFDDVNARIPANLDAEDSRAYELVVLRLLREAFVDVPSVGVLIVDAVELSGSCPDTIVQSG
jgi:hypothetical protein